MCCWKYFKHQTSDIDIKMWCTSTHTSMETISRSRAHIHTRWSTHLCRKDSKQARSCEMLLNTRLTLMFDHVKAVKAKMKKLDWLSLLERNELQKCLFAIQYAHLTAIIRHSHRHGYFVCQILCQEAKFCSRKCSSTHTSTMCHRTCQTERTKWQRKRIKLAGWTQYFSIRQKTKENTEMLGRRGGKWPVKPKKSEGSNQKMQISAFQKSIFFFFKIFFFTFFNGFLPQHFLTHTKT